MPERERRDRRRLRALAGFWRVAGSPQGSSEREAQIVIRIRSRSAASSQGAGRAVPPSIASRAKLYFGSIAYQSCD